MRQVLLPHRYGKYSMEIFCPECGQMHETAQGYARHMVQEHKRDPKVMQDALQRLGFDVDVEYMTHVQDDYSK